jgi:hypothetical protein
VKISQVRVSERTLYNSHMSDHFDLVVMGAGSAAVNVAYPCRAAGHSSRVGIDIQLNSPAQKIEDGAGVRVTTPSGTFAGAAAVHLPKIEVLNLPTPGVEASPRGRIVAANLLHTNHERTNFLGVASTVFALPALASCGQTRRISGAHINLSALATRHGLSAEQIKEPLNAYPPHGSDPQYML